MKHNHHDHHDHHHPHKKPDPSGSCDPTYPTGSSDSGSVGSGSMFNVPPPSGSEPDMGPSGSCKFDEKLALPDSIMKLIGEVVQNMAQIQSVVNNMQAGSYQKAIADLLQLVTNIITHMILPKVVNESAAHSQYMGAEPEPMMHDD
jgi:hypothetical protein